MELRGQKKEVQVSTRINLKSLPRVATFALISGTKEISDTFAMAAFLFSGALAPGYPLAALIFLVGTIVIRASVALFSRLPNAVGGPQEIGMSVIGGVIAGLPIVAANPGVGVATALAICGATSLLTGLLFASVGFFKLAHYARLLPYPVLGGFLAGSGWLLVRGGAIMALGAEHDSNILQPNHWLELAADTEKLTVLVPALGLAVLMYLVVSKRSSTAPIVLIGSTLLFYIVLYTYGITPDVARIYGWLPIGAVDEARLQFDLSLVTKIDWSHVIAAVPLMLVAASLSTVSILLNLSGLSLRTRSDIDVNREMVSQGLANVFIGAVGGMAGFVTVGSTSLAHKLGVSRLAAGISVVIVLLMGVTFAGPMTNFLPIFLTSGLIIYAGLEFLIEWVFESRSRLPLVDWLLIILILGIIIFAGILQGIFAGIMLSVVMFVYNYAKIPVIRTYGTISDLRSHVDRSPEANAILKRMGETCEVVSLQGYLFFATAEMIVSHVRTRVGGDASRPLGYLVMDFSHVGGCDSAAISAFANIINIAVKHRFILLLAGMSVDIRHLFELSEMIFIDETIVREFPDTDHAIEYCEEAILSENLTETSHTVHDAVTFLTPKIGDHADLAEVARRFRTLHLKQGDYLIRKGEAADDVFIILSGRVHVQIELPNGRTLRLRTMTPGAIVGDIALYTGQRRTADVVIDEDATVLCLSAESLRDIEETSGNMAARIHRIFAQTLAEKLVLANNAIRVAQR